MGVACGGIAFKATQIEKTLQEIVEFVFEMPFEKSGYCDSRNDGCVFMGKVNDTIVIVNSKLADKFFKDEIIGERIMSFFNNPKLAFAFQEYDSGATYGYSIFEDGKLVRRIQATNYNDVEQNFGEPFEIETKWFNAKIVEDNRNGEIVKHRVIEEINQGFPDDFLYKSLLQLLMIDQLGFSCPTMDDKFTEMGHYQKINQNRPSADKTKSKKWWEIWK